MDKTHSFSFLVILCTVGQRTVLASCEQDAVGVAGYILDSQLAASSVQNASTPAKNGRLNFTEGTSWCASTSDTSPYLQIDLQSLYIICAVSTQGNSQGSQWVETYTLKSSTDGKTWTDYEENGQIKKFNGNFNANSAEKQNLFDEIVARYLRFVVVAKHGEACLRAEVFGVPRRKVYSNIALLKPTIQSSTLWSYMSSNAVEGGTGTDISKCTHTYSETNPWWRVDLGRVEPVAEVNILNRNSNADRLNGAELRVGNKTTNRGANNHLCGNITQILASSSKTFVCTPKAYGRYVYIIIPGNGKILTLCEVEVYSYLLAKNVALKRSADQISTNWGGVASRAVDGNVSTDFFAGSCTHTSIVNDSWWRVDLGSAFSVAEVVIVNRACIGACGKLLRGFEIRIGNSTQNGGVTNPSCGGTHSMTSGETKAFVCTSSPVGQFVSVRIPGKNKVLTLCEVQVYSTKQDRDSVKGCALDPVGVSDSSIILDQRFSASSSHSSSSPTYGRLNGANAWIPATNNDNNDYLQIDLGSVYIVCGVATEGSPNNGDWTKTYKIQTSLDYVHWNPYSENGSLKIFTGNDDRSSIVRSELYKPLAAKFIRFYPILFNNNKALRVEVYGSRQGCLTSLKNERGKTRDFRITASSESTGHVASSSRLYGGASWCSSSVSPPQYLEVDFRQIITVAGVATQGDAAIDKWVTSYSIIYGYDGQTWISYGAGQIFTGNRDRGTIIVHWFSPPFAARYVRIVPQTYNNGICMRMDLFGCKDFQVPFPLSINFDDVRLMANTSASVVLNCVASYSQRRPSAYEWSKDGIRMSESSASHTIRYTTASDFCKTYSSLKRLSAREVECGSTYQCNASISAKHDKHVTTANVTVILKTPGQPVVKVNSGDIKARSALVTWSYSPGVDEMPVTAYYLEYQNSSFKDNMSLGVATSKQLMNLKPHTTYRVRLMAISFLGKGLWNNLVNFVTKTDAPEGSPSITNASALSSQTIYIQWQKPSPNKVNGPIRQYQISYKEAGGAAKIAVVSGSTTNYTLTNLKKWTDYVLRIRVNNGIFDGPWSPEWRVRTKQDAPSPPKNLYLTVQGPKGGSGPQLTIKWMKPDSENGVITHYRLAYSYTLEGRATSQHHNFSHNVFSFNFRVLGGILYTVRVRAETVVPGPDAVESIQVPTYRPSIPPQSIKSQTISGTTYNITWLPLSREKSNGKIVSYEVKTSAFPKQCSKGAIADLLDVYYNVSQTTHNFILSNLRPCTEYEVRIRVYTAAGPSAFGNLPVPIDTSVPLAPTGLYSLSPQTTSIVLKWRKPVLNSHLVESYQIVFNGTKSYFQGFNDSRVIYTSGPVLTYKVENLSPGTRYTFTVRARSTCGIGDATKDVVVDTLVDYPKSPNVLVVEKISTLQTSLPVTLWSAKPFNGPISHYHVIVHRVRDWADEIPEENNKQLLDYAKSQEQKQPFYIAAEMQSTSVHPSLTFNIGDGKSYGSYKNVALVKSSKYKVYIRAVTTVPKVTVMYS